jgi:hypothetical protein
METRCISLMLVVAALDNRPSSGNETRERIGATMAIFCTTCDHELRITDKFCAKCGTRVRRGALAAQPEQWEFCYLEGAEAKTLLSSRMCFLAEASGPYGKREAGRSATLNSTPTQYNQGMLSREGQQMLGALMRTLIGQGWEYMPGRGEQEWSYQFRRPLSPGSERLSYSAALPPPTKSYDKMTQQRLKAQYAQQDLDRALAIVERFLQATDPHSVDHVQALWVDKVQVLADVDPVEVPRVFAQALDLVEECLRRDPDDPDWWGCKSAILSAQGRKPESEEAARKAKLVG